MSETHSMLNVVRSTGIALVAGAGLCLPILGHPPVSTQVSTQVSPQVSPHPDAPPAPPNVLFIISDDLSAGALSCYGNRQCTTPAIDALAARGTRYTRAYCQYPVCGPSRASMLAGLYPNTLGIMSNASAQRIAKAMDGHPTLPQYFKQQGYFTARSSKVYHMLIPGDITRGVHGPDHPASWTQRFSFAAPEWRSLGEHEHLSNEKLKTGKDKHYSLGFGTAFYVVQAEGDGSEQIDVQATDKAIEILAREHASPFFLALGLVRPHVPLVAPQRFFDPYSQEDMRLPELMEGDWDDIPERGRPKTAARFGLDTLEKQRKVLSAYYASVAFMDAQVGRVMEALHRLELHKNTIVIFTSDHGYHLGEHEFWQKSSLHEESARVPLIISVPGQAPARCSSLAQLMDLYPTLCDLCGLARPEHLEGKSLSNTLSAPNHVVHEYVYSTFAKAPNTGHLIRTERFAYMRWPDDSEELYDMHADPLQFTNLSQSPAHQELKAGLRQTLKAHLR